MRTDKKKLQYPTIGFYGAGNMANAIIRGLLLSGWPTESIIACRRNETRLKQLTDLKILTTTNGLQLARSCDILILGVKPWQIEDSCNELKAHLRADITVVSLAAGITHKTIADILDVNWVVRAMPNTPVALGHGVTALYSTQASHPRTLTIADFFSRVGYCFQLTGEEEMHSVIAISGSGPAYYFHIMSLMQQTAQQLGMDENTAKLLVANTMSGAALMAQQNTDFAQLRNQIVSKGGTTEAALKQFDEHHLAQTIEAALTACRNKSIELSG